MTLAVERKLPALQQQAQLLLAAHQRRELVAGGRLEAAGRFAYP